MFLTFFKIQKRDFLRFFALLHTFSRTMTSSKYSTKVFEIGIQKKIRSFQRGKVQFIESRWNSPVVLLRHISIGLAPKATTPYQVM